MITDSYPIFDIITNNIALRVNMATLKQLRCCKYLDKKIYSILKNNKMSIFNYLFEKVFNPNKQNGYRLVKLFDYYKLCICYYEYERSNIFYDVKTHDKYHKKLYELIFRVRNEFSNILNKYFIGAVNVNLDFNMDDLSRLKMNPPVLSFETIYYSLLIVNNDLLSEYLSFISLDTSFLNIYEYIPNLNVKYLTVNYLQTYESKIFGKVTCKNLIINYDPISIEMVRSNHDYKNNVYLNTTYKCKMIYINFTKSPILTETETYNTYLDRDVITIKSSVKYLIIKNNTNRYTESVYIDINPDTDILVILDFEKIILNKFLANTKIIICGCKVIKFVYDQTKLPFGNCVTSISKNLYSCGLDPIIKFREHKEKNNEYYGPVFLYKDKYMEKCSTDILREFVDSKDSYMPYFCMKRDTYSRYYKNIINCDNNCDYGNRNKSNNTSFNLKQKLLKKQKDPNKSIRLENIGENDDDRSTEEKLAYDKESTYKYELFKHSTIIKKINSGLFADVTPYNIIQKLKLF